MNNNTTNTRNENDLQALNKFIAMYNTTKQSPTFEQSTLDFTVQAIDGIVNKNTKDKDIMAEAIRFDEKYVDSLDDSLKNDFDYINQLAKAFPNIDFQKHGININNVVNDQQQTQAAPTPTPAPAAPTPAPAAQVDGDYESYNNEALQNYSNSGFGKNADGWYFNPSTDEYDENYDPTKDDLFNKHLNTMSDWDKEALQNYSNSGFGKNADGWYFNPSTDEYEENYDPTKDSFFNKHIRTKLTTGKNADELLNEVILNHNIMGSLINEDPYIGIEKTNCRDSKYGLNAEQIKDFTNAGMFVNEVNNIAPQVMRKYADLLKQLKEARQKIADVLGKEPYPGIEDEDLDAAMNDISKQMDDWERDQLTENKNKIDNLKKQYPALFANVINKNKNQSVDPNKNPNPTGDNKDPNKKDEDNKDPNKKDEDNKDPNKKDEDNKDPNKKDDDNKDKTDGDKNKDPDKPFEITEQNTPSIFNTKLDKEFWTKKALPFAVGVVGGVALSAIPGVGAIRMGIAGVKLAATASHFAIKTITTRYPESKAGKWLRATDENFKAKHPRIYNAGQYMHKRFKSPPINSFINGVSVGYLAGNVFEMVTGNSISEAITARLDARFNPPHIDPVVPDGTTFDNVTTVSNVTPDPIPPINPVPPTIPTPVVPDTDAIEAAIKAGQQIDLSSIPVGRVSSDAQNAVKLIQSAGRNVHFLREVTLRDGTVMWAMDQANGLGYAWFPKDQVMEVAQGLAQTAGRTL